jgi:hypothetical protein
LSELHLTLGNVLEAIDTARRSFEASHKCGDEFLRLSHHTTLANALHQFGDLASAVQLFRDAEKIQAKRQPNYPILYSFQGYLYCDFLLTQGEPEEVLRRATQTLEWAKGGSLSLLTIALDHLSLGRAHDADSTEATKHFSEAVSGLRRVGLDDLPRGLLARAAHFRHTREWDKAQHDLDEVRVLATRCGMRLFLTDYHLEQARLFLAQGKPSDEARPHYEAAAKLVEETGYHRRDADLAELRSQLGIPTF